MPLLSPKKKKKIIIGLHYTSNVSLILWTKQMCKISGRARKFPQGGLAKYI